MCRSKGSDVPTVKDHIVTLQELKAGVPPERALQQLPPNYDYWYHSELYAYQVDEKLERHQGSECQEACVDGEPHDAGWICQFCRTMYSFNANQYRRKVHMNHLKQCTMYNSFRDLSRLERLQARALFMAALEAVDRPILIREEDERMGWKQVKKEQDDEWEERRTEWLAESNGKQKKRRIQSPSPSPPPPRPSASSSAASSIRNSACRELEDALDKSASLETTIQSPPKRLPRASLRKSTSLTHSATWSRPTNGKPQSSSSSSSASHVTSAVAASHASSATLPSDHGPCTTKPSYQSGLELARDSLEPVIRRFTYLPFSRKEAAANPSSASTEAQSAKGGKERLSSASQSQVHAQTSSNISVPMTATAEATSSSSLSRGPDRPAVPSVAPASHQSKTVSPAPVPSASSLTRKTRTPTPARVLGSSSTPFDLTLDTESDEEEKPKINISSAGLTRRTRPVSVAGLPDYLQQYTKWFRLGELEKAEDLQMELEAYQAAEFVETLRSRGEKEGEKMNAFIQTRFTADLKRFLS